MEVVGERTPPPLPPPLPPKTRMINFQTGFYKNRNIIARGEEVSPPGREREELKSGEKSPRTLSKFANGSDSKQCRGFKLGSKDDSRKIITWAQKKEQCLGNNNDSLLSINSFYKSNEPDDEFLYQNVSNTGTNYIEYKLNGIINNNGNGNAEKVKNTKNQRDSNRKIEVRQIKNKTVVKISIKDDDKTWKNGSLYRFKPVKLDVKSGSDFLRGEQEGKFEEEEQLYANLNASDPECDQTYENQIGNSRKNRKESGKEMTDDVEQIYENKIFGCRDSATYQNLSDFKPVVRVNCNGEKVKNKKVVVTINDTSKEKKADESSVGRKRGETVTISGVGSDSSDSEGSNISSDSLNSNEFNAIPTTEDHCYKITDSENNTGSPIDSGDYQNVVGVRGNNGNGNSKTTVELPAAPEEIYENFRVFEKKKPLPPPPPPPPPKPQKTRMEEVKSLPEGLLRDIQSMNVKLSSPKDDFEEKKSEEKHFKVEEKTYEERNKVNVKSERTNRICAMDVDTDRFYKFHLFENKQESNGEKNEEETFAGVKDYLNREKQAAIKSAKGTIRGVKNRVKAGIATFLQMQENKNYKDRDAGKIVVYSTTMGIVRETYHKCLKVKQILRTLMVKFEDRDVFMSAEAQDEIRERMRCDAILVPQVFVEGQHIGDAETIERLNETGELRKILKPYKSPDACSTCQICGGYRLLPCSICKGSKKSIHRNHFTAEFVALKCMNCDQVGLTKCYAC